MTYKEAEKLVNENRHLIGTNVDRKENALDGYNVIVLLIATDATMSQVFNNWWYNGRDNKTAIAELKSPIDANDFQVFVIGYNGDGNTPYYILNTNLD